MLGPIHDAAPELTEAEITMAFDALIARGNIFAPDLSPPLTEREMLIRDVILRQAQEHACRDADTVTDRTG
jgi:hypothetical protein